MTVCPFAAHGPNRSLPTHGRFAAGAAPMVALMLCLLVGKLPAAEYHIVKAGDTCATILARYFQGDQTLFQNLNRQERCISTALYIGRRIRVP